MATLPTRNEPDDTVISPNLGKITVLVINHNPILLEGIAVLISRQPDMTLVAATSDVTSAIPLYLRERPDVTVIDLELPASSAFQIIREILRRRPPAKLIGLTTWDVARPASDALAAGVAAVVAKDRVAEDLPALIRSRDPRRH